VAQGSSPGAGTRRDNAPPDPESLSPSQSKRRRNIVMAALHLLEERPYERIQMRDVADRAGVALGTVYRYFVSKEHLFAAVLMAWSDQLSEHVQRRPLRGETPTERLKDMMTRVLNSFERWPQFFEVVMLLEATPDEYARRCYAHYAEDTTRTFAEAVQDLDPDGIEDVMTVITAVLSSLVRAWTLGSIGMPEARSRMMGAIELIFSEPPRTTAPARELEGARENAGGPGKGGRN
jgi:TetR/AcrR family transcriptional regulator, cholesterol catabolism regulator